MRRRACGRSGSALGDAPQACSPSLGEEGLPLSYWEDWATSEDKVVFVAEEDGSWLGMAGAFVHPDKRGGESVVAVACTERPPEPRRRLVDARANWARERVRSGSSWRSPRTTGQPWRSTGASASSRQGNAGRWPRIRRVSGSSWPGRSEAFLRSVHGPGLFRWGRHGQGPSAAVGRCSTAPGSRSRTSKCRWHSRCRRASRTMYVPRTSWTTLRVRSSHRSRSHR